MPWLVGTTGVHICLDASCPRQWPRRYCSVGGHFRETNTKISLSTTSTCQILHSPLQCWVFDLLSHSEGTRCVEDSKSDASLWKEARNDWWIRSLMEIQVLSAAWSRRHPFPSAAVKRLGYGCYGMPPAMQWVHLQWVWWSVSRKSRVSSSHLTKPDTKMDWRWEHFHSSGVFLLKWYTPDLEVASKAVLKRRRSRHAKFGQAGEW